MLAVLRRAELEAPGVHRDDLLGGVAVALLIVLATFPIIVPYLVVADPNVAVRVSNAIALTLLFLLGMRWGQIVGGRPVWIGAGLTLIGLVLVMVTIVLGDDSPSIDTSLRDPAESNRRRHESVSSGRIHHDVGDLPVAVAPDVPGGSTLVVRGAADDHRGGCARQAPGRGGLGLRDHRGANRSVRDHGCAVGVVGTAVVTVRVVIVVIVLVVLPVFAAVRGVVLPVVPRLIPLLLALLLPLLPAAPGVGTLLNPPPKLPLAAGPRPPTSPSLHATCSVALTEGAPRRRAAA